MSEPLRDELITLTSDLIRFQSTSDRPDQLAAVMQYVDQYLSALPGLFIHRSTEADKPAIVVTFHDTREPTLMLNGHLDVVPATPEQFEPQVRDGRIYGRGSLDMKGSDAVLLRLLKELASQENRPDVGVQFVTDEEIGGAHGTNRLVKEGWRCGFFIAAEPTDLRICHQQKGGIWMNLEIPGAPGHASRPWESTNPNFALAEGLIALKKRFPPPDREEWKTTVTPTAISSPGDAHNQVPPAISLTIDIRRIPEDDPEALIAAVQECFPTATITDQRKVSPLDTPADDATITRLAAVTEELRGCATDIYREHFASDARFYSKAGMPSVCFGPSGQGLHAATEWVEIDGLIQFYEVLRAYIAHTT
jgi:succinyl-diaminopimelate desuccinylase